jgi:periplasmic copper chaperone A
VTRSARLPRAAALSFALAAAAALTLSGCAAGQISQTADQVAAIDGGNGTIGQIGIRNVVMVTARTDAGYAKGDTVDLSLLISNNGLNNDTLTGVSSVAASSGTVAPATGVALPAQQLVTVGGDSQIKLELQNLTQAIPYGHSVPISFTFQNAGKLTIDVPIEIPATRSSDRSKINIQPAEPTPLWDTVGAPS